MLAISQSAIHLYYDYDKITLTPTQPKSESTTEQLSKIPDPTIQLKQSLSLLVPGIVLRALGTSIFGPIVYAIFIRSTAWDISLHVAELFWDVPNSRLSYIPPYHISLIVRSCIAGGSLITLWEVSNLVFSVYCAQEPLKREQPLTSESKDPNGSLLIGLKSRKEVARVLYCLAGTMRYILTCSSLLRFGNSPTSANDLTLVEKLSFRT